MKKKELIDRLKEAGIEGANETFDVMVEVIGQCLVEGEDITLPGIGTLKTKETSARKGINPKTGEEIQIDAKKTVKFKAAKGIKDALNS